MFTKPPYSGNKGDKDIASRIIGAIGDETEKIADSTINQITGDTVPINEPDPISQAMQQKTEEEEIDKQNKLNKQKKFIRTREELENELSMIKQKSAEAEKARMEEMDRQFKTTSPGEEMNQGSVLPLTTKPKRGQAPGKPGSAKGETGPEVRKSKQ